MAINETISGQQAVISGIPLWSVGMITFTAALTAVVLRRMHRTVVLVILLGVFTGLEGLVIMINAIQSQPLIELTILIAIFSWISFTAELLYLYQRIRTFLPQIQHVWITYVVFVFIGAISLSRLGFGIVNATSVGDLALGTTGGSKLISLGTVRSLGTGVINLLTIIFDVLVSLILVYSLSSKFTRGQQFSNNMLKFLASSRLRVLLAMIFGLIAVVLSVFVTDVTTSTTINSLEAAKDAIYIGDTVILLLLTNTYVNNNNNIATTVYYGDSRRPSDASTAGQGMIYHGQQEKSMAQTSAYNRPGHMLNESWDAVLPRHQQMANEDYSRGLSAAAAAAFPSMQPRPSSKGSSLPSQPPALSIGASSQFQQAGQNHSSWMPQRPAPVPPLGGPFGQQDPLHSRPVFGAVNWQAGTAAAARGAPVRIPPPLRPDLVQQEPQRPTSPKISFERATSRESDHSYARSESNRSGHSDNLGLLEEVDPQQRRLDLADAVRVRQPSQASMIQSRQDCNFSDASMDAIQPAGRQRTPSDFYGSNMLPVPQGRHGRNGSESSIATSMSSARSVISQFPQTPALSPMGSRSRQMSKQQIMSPEAYERGYPMEPPLSALPMPPQPLQISKRRPSPPRLQIPEQVFASTPIQIVFNEPHETTVDIMPSRIEEASQEYSLTEQTTPSITSLLRSESSGSDVTARPVTGQSMQSFASISVYSADTSYTEQHGLQRGYSMASAYAEDSYADTDYGRPPMPALPSPYKNQGRPARPFE